MKHTEKFIINIIVAVVIVLMCIVTLNTFGYTQPGLEKKPYTFCDNTVSGVICRKGQKPSFTQAQYIIESICISSQEAREQSNGMCDKVFMLRELMYPESGWEHILQDYFGIYAIGEYIYKK